MLQNMLMSLRAGFLLDLLCCLRNCLSLRQRQVLSAWYGLWVEHSEWEAICPVAEETSSPRTKFGRWILDR